MRTVLICDDRRSVREGLTRVMSAVPGVQRIDCVSTADELLTRYARQSADVVFVGTQRAVASGAEATRRLMAAHPQAVFIGEGQKIVDRGEVELPLAPFERVPFQMNLGCQDLAVAQHGGAQSLVLTQMFGAGGGAEVAAAAAGRAGQGRNGSGCVGQGGAFPLGPCPDPVWRNGQGRNQRKAGQYGPS